MKFITIAVCALLLSASLCGHWGDYKEEDDVVVGTKTNFDEFIGKHSHVLVEFYAPWCGHCQKLAPEYSAAAKKLKETEPGVPLMKVDATAEAELGTRFEVQGYPTLKFIINGTPVEYAGGRTTDEIVAWVQKKTGPASKLIESNADLDKLKADNKVMIAFFGEEGASYTNYMTGASGFDGVTFVHVFNADMVAEYGKRVVMFKQFDEKRNDLEGDFDAERLTNFVNSHRYETVMPFEGDAAIERIFGKEKSAIFLFSEKDGPHTDIFKGLAAENKDRIIFSTSTVTSGLGQRLAEYVGVKEEEAPCVRIVNPSNGDLSKFVYTGALEKEPMSKFLADFEAGLLSRHFKSQEIPEKNDESVRTVVGKNFDAVVLDDTKDVLVEFYAPWCGHCKALAPKYEEVAKKLAYMSNDLVIAKVDSTENEIQNVNVRGFPTIKFYKKGQKDEPKDFDGDRTEEGMIKFLKENVSFPWKDDDSTQTDL